MFFINFQFDMFLICYLVLDFFVRVKIIPILFESNNDQNFIFGNTQTVKQELISYQNLPCDF